MAGICNLSLMQQSLQPYFNEWSSFQKNGKKIVGGPCL